MQLQNEIRSGRNLLRHSFGTGHDQRAWRVDRENVGRRLTRSRDGVRIARRHGIHHARRNVLQPFRTGLADIQHCVMDHARIAGPNFDRTHPAVHRELRLKDDVLILDRGVGRNGKRAGDADHQIRIRQNAVSGPFDRWGASRFEPSGAPASAHAWMAAISAG